MKRVLAIAAGIKDRVSSGNYLVIALPSFACLAPQRVSACTTFSMPYMRTEMLQLLSVPTRSPIRAEPIYSYIYICVD